MSALAKLFSEADVAKRRVKDFLRSPLAYLQMVADQQRNLWKQDPEAQAMNFFNPEAGLLPLAGVIKQKGGNWLSGSVEGALSGLKKREGIVGTPEWAQGDNEVGAAAINNFIDKQLTRYVKNEMATPEDPIRALAESWPSRQAQELADYDRQIAKVRSDAEKAIPRLRATIPNFNPEFHMTSTNAAINEILKKRQQVELQQALHVDPGQLPFGGRMVHPSGEDLKKFGQNEVAKRWENASDYMIYPEEARRFKYSVSGTTGRPTIERNPWLEKLSDETTVYDLIPNPRISDLGFNHLIDELSNAINPQSGLPQNLLLPADRLNKVSVPQAVERVAAINAWRAVQKAEADAKLANNAATVLYKEYPDKGMKWVELRPAEQLNPEYELKQIQGKNGSYWDLRKPGAPYGHTTNTELEAIRASNREALEQALKYEGGTMGHCVGGYCDDVLQGRSRIYSLRDAKGQPHVTIEVQPKSETEFLRERWKDYADIKQEGQDFAHRWITQELAKQPQRIIQIKGKGNAKPIDEYLPFVQDFVRSGKWSDVGDLQNTGLIRAGDQDAMVRAALTGKPIGIDEGYTAAKRIGERQPYFTQDELIEAFKSEFPDKFASGGPVRSLDPNMYNKILEALR